jgi:protein-S-isoprenylcysteine O-methyltransferase Ste14
MTRLPALGPRGEGWFALQLVLVVLVGLAGLLFGPDWTEPARSVTLFAGVLLVLAGLVLGARGVVDLGRAVTPFPRPSGGAPLVEHGAYRYVRHPIYGGLILSSAGWGLLNASLAALAVGLALAIVLDLKSRREEAWLSQHFADYDAYARRTRRFAPGLY